MAKYSIDSSTLTDIADAIRTQYGEDTPIAVTDMAEAILGIEGGGGGDEFPYLFDCGEFSLSSSKTVMVSSTSGGQTHDAYIIEHNLGKTPIFFQLYFLYPSGSVPTSTVDRADCKYQHYSSQKDLRQYVSQINRANGSTNSTGQTLSVTKMTRGGTYVYVDDEIIAVGDRDGVTTANQTFVLHSGITYKWFAIAEKD